MEVCCENYVVEDHHYQGTECMRITDAMNLASEVIKSRKAVSTSPSTKNSKTMKKDTTTTIKSTDKKPQATPEQLRIAQLINTKKEDPKLKEKLRQVMDATQRSMEEAYLALHDCEFDPNRAVDLLIEGNVEKEWSTLSKKKKNKNPGEKPVRNKTENVQEVTQENEPWDSSLSGKPSIGNRGSSGRGRGKGFRGRGNTYQTPEFIDRGRRFSNRYNNSNHNNEETVENVCDIIPSRTFERAITPIIRPTDTWDPKRPIASLLNQNRSDDWDEEEYTGPLTTLVYTSSGNSPQTKMTNPPNLPAATLEANKPILTSIVSPSSGSYSSKPEEQVLASLAFESSASSSPALATATVVNSPLKIRSPPIGANITKPPPIIEKQKENQDITISRVTSKPPLINKLPNKPVEMPPNSANSNIGVLDIQFGSIDLKDDSQDVTIFPSQTNLPVTSKGTDVNHKNDTTGNVTPVSSSEINSSPSSSLHKDHISHVSSSPKKPPHQTQLVYSSPYLSSLVSTSNTMSTTPNQSTYSSTGGIGSTTTSCPQYHYSSYVTQPSPSVPILPNLSSAYQNILGTQSFSTSSQSIYGTNVLPTTSYTVSYQTYSSTAQHKPTIVPLPYTGTKDFDSGSHNLNLATRSVTASSMLSSSQSYPSTKASTLPKSPMLSNMPPLISHQHPLYIGQGGIPYYQPPIYYQDLQLMQQQRLASPISAAYYDVGYTSLSRDGMPYNVSDRGLAKQEGTGTIHHGAQVMGGCVTSHLSTSGDVFGGDVATDSYGHCEGICDSASGDCSGHSQAQSSQLMQPGMTLMDNPNNICSKSIN